MKIKYQFFPEHKLFIQKYSEDWSLDQFAEFVRFAKDGGFIEQNSKILSDFRDLTNVKAIIENIEKVRDVSVKSQMPGFISVMLVDKPLPTAAAHSYQANLTGRNRYAYCSTLKQALKLLELNNNFTENEIKFFLSNLENTFL